MNRGNQRIQQMTILAMLAALAYIVMVVGRIPVVLFLKYDPKDVVIAISGLLYGPLSAMSVSLVVSLVEMLTVSDTGFIGMVMNFLSSATFSCTAALLYCRRRTLKNAVIGLVAGCLLTTAVMILWNYLITPLYMGYPREAVAAMLVPYFLPFNLLKYGLNAAITLLLYKPLVTGLRRAHLLPESTGGQARGGRINLAVTLGAALALVTLVLLGLVFMGIL
ncbi:MAG: ECF transporter S component [Christensenellales bacterium]|uniref:ECF transporter S component n=1 Tax=Candidatus Avichristensenella intestinipullorum TaxID=2840693 RepID=A0A9D0YXB1_9FIRM|nr:ECF transporter S component [Christensenellales bacterium]HIQ62533.1 ECF transporter S component [Candidatus Avichristensenella intestinipullorum]